MILTAIAMILTMLSFDYATFNMESKRTWYFLAAVIILIASIVLIFVKENKLDKQAH